MERPPRFLGNPCTRVPRSTTPMGVTRPCLERTDYCGLPSNLPRRPPPHAPLRGSITRPTCVLSTLHDEGHPIAMQDSLPACWLGVDWAGLAPAGFQPRISRGSSATSFPIEPGFPGAQISGARELGSYEISIYDDSQESKGYCWPTPRCRNLCVQHACFEGKKAEETPQ